jgi:hypothetical protein
MLGIDNTECIFGRCQGIVRSNGSMIDEMNDVVLCDPFFFRLALSLGVGEGAYLCAILQWWTWLH